MLECTWQAIDLAQWPDQWSKHAHRHWPAYRRWFLREGERARCYYWTCFKALTQFMPEMVDLYEHLLDSIDSDDQDLLARFLSGYCPPPYIHGCSQAVWTMNNPTLIRNYDYNPHLFEATVLKTHWHQPVLALSDCLWGVVDGVNGAGLVVSLTFGGRRCIGVGFGMPLILRYVLEFCYSVDQAVVVLSRVPTHMAYNVTVMDKTGYFRTVQLAPDQPAKITCAPVTTNHQSKMDWPQHAHATATVERERYLSFRLRDCQQADDLLRAFMHSPVYSTAYRKGFGTLYTAQYRAQPRELTLHWPNGQWHHSLQHFTMGQQTIYYPQGKTQDTSNTAYQSSD